MSIIQEASIPQSPRVSSDASWAVSLPLVSHAIGGLCILAGIIWAYWPTLVSTVEQWERQPDYSHGFLVPPIAIAFLWLRRRSLRLNEIQPNLWGAAALLLVGAIRALAGAFYLQPVDGWTFPLTIAGAILLLYGWQVFRWSLPSVVFLWFMMPIPYSAERWLSLPLQSLATKLSTAALLCLGQPAIAEGHTILLGEERLFVEEACSGLRIFVGIFALAFGFALFSRWTWWQKAFVLAAALPTAIVSNVIRIVATGLLFQLGASETARRFSHDISGFVMIPLAALLLWAVLVYLDRLFPEIEEVAPGSMRTTHQD